MIADGDYLAVLLPTYGHFTGKSYYDVTPTGKWLEYGMVNIVRFEDDNIVENWFGMDPLAEQQQMGSAPSFPPRQLNEIEKANIELFQKSINKSGMEFDNLTAFNDIVLALGPPQGKMDTSLRRKVGEKSIIMPEKASESGKTQKESGKCTSELLRKS